MRTRLASPLHFLALFIVCSIPNCLHAQNTDTTRIPYSIFLQGGITKPIATNVFCLDNGACPPFLGGMGGSFDALLATRFKLISDLQMRVGIGGGMWSTTMRSTDAAGRTRDAQGNVVDFVREQTLTANSSYLSVVGSVAYSINQFRFSAGPRIEYALGAPTWQQTSRIISPSNVTYPDGSREISSVPLQSIPQANALRITAMATAEFPIALTTATEFAPYLSLAYSPMSVRTGADWNDMRVTVGVSLHSVAEIVRIHDKEVPPTPQEPTATPPIADRSLTIKPTSVTPQPRQASEKTAVRSITSKETSSVSSAGTASTSAESLSVSAPSAPAAISKLPVLADRYRTNEIVDTTMRTIRGSVAGVALIRGSEQRRIDTIFTDTERVIATTVRRTDTLLQTTIYTKPNIVLQRGITNSGNDAKKDKISVRFTTQEQSQTFSVLPFVFFDSAAAAIPRRYRLPLSITSFDASATASDQHSMYLEVLNVIGSRMRESTDTIMLIGYSDSLSEGGSCDLAFMRAAAVRDYLVRTWGISSGRLSIAESRTICSPGVPSPGGNEQGRAENRRVEVLTPRFELYLPIVRRDVTVIIDSDLDSLRVSADSPTDPVNKWITRLRQNEAIIHERQHASIKNSVAFSVPNNMLSKLQPEKPVQVQLIGITAKGDTLETTVGIPVTIRHERERLRSLALAMFEFRRSSLSARDSSLLREFARRLNPNDRVSVNGYTDELGAASFNDLLSRDRANTVADRLRIERPDCVITNIIGHGARKFPRGLDSYALPEQRFMCRTVQLEVANSE